MKYKNPLYSTTLMQRGQRRRWRIWPKKIFYIKRKEQYWRKRPKEWMMSRWLLSEDTGKK